MNNVLRAAAMASAIALSACTTAEKDDSFAVACASVSVADAGFQLYAATGRVSAKTIEKERVAVAAAQAVCSGPRPADVRTSMAAVQRALTAIIEATRQARVQAGA